MDNNLKKIIDSIPDKEWERFSEIQCATWIQQDAESVERYLKWVETGDDNEAWS